MSLNDICHNIIYCDNIIYAVILHIMGASRVAQWIKNLPAMQEMQADVGSIPGLGRSPDRKSTRLNSSHRCTSRMPSSA